MITNKKKKKDMESRVNGKVWGKWEGSKYWFTCLLWTEKPWSVDE